MIEITIPSGRYTREELFDKLSKYFKTDEDIEMFITAMQETNQIVEVEPNVFETTAKREVKRRVPLYLTIPPEDEVMGDRINQIYVFRWTYYTYKGEKLPRIAIRAGANWVKRRGTPLRATLIKIYKDGRWIRIPERPVMLPGTPRYPKTIEAYRAEIPREIVRKYGITRDTPLRVKLETMVTNYLATLRLWGYAITCMIFFGETKNKVNPRTLELIGRDFVYETRRNIREMLETKSNKVLSLMQEVLEKLDLEYYALLLKCIDDETASIQKPLEGVDPDPLVDREERIAKIEFIDPNRLFSSIIAMYQSKYPLDDIPDSIDVFEEVENTLITTLQEARKESKMIKYVQTKLGNVGGF